MNHPVAAFLRKLPDMACPEVLLEEDGDLCFDWHGGPRWVCSVSLSEGGRVGYAALLGEQSYTGHFELSEWPEAFDALLSRVAGGL